MDWVFFADEIYNSINGILFTIFNNIYGDFSEGLRIVINALFHFFIVFYAFLAIKNGIVSSVFSIARTVVLLLVSFNFSFNYANFKAMVYDFILNFPNDIAAYFVSSTIASSVSGFKPPQEFDTSKLFASLAGVIINRADSSRKAISGMPSIETFYLIILLVLVVLLYYAFWLIQFNFLIQASIYLIIGIPIFMLASFRETQHIFLEWLRAVATLMLYPVIASIIIFIILNILEPLTADMKNILNDSHVALSAAGTLFATLVFGLFAMRNIPAMAAVLTRGTVTQGNALGPAMSMVSKSVDFLKGASTRGVDMARGAYNNYQDTKNMANMSPGASGAPSSPSTNAPLVNSADDSIQKTPRLPGPESGSGGASNASSPSDDSSSSVAGSNLPVSRASASIKPARESESARYQSAPGASTTRASQPTMAYQGTPKLERIDQPNGSNASKTDTRTIEIKPESVTTAPDITRVGHRERQAKALSARKTQDIIERESAGDIRDSSSPQLPPATRSGYSPSQGGRGFPGSSAPTRGEESLYQSNATRPSAPRARSSHKPAQTTKKGKKDETPSN